MSDNQPLTKVQWLICIIASIGFAFDIYELLMLPLVLRPALGELLGLAPGTPEFNSWRGWLFFFPAVVGGVFGLLGGYLTDRFGRRRVLTGSILLYAVSAFCAGLSTNIWMLLFFRTTTFIGVCVEFVAAVAWLAELFPEPKRRERVLGFTQFFSSFGGLLVAVVNSWFIAHADRLPYEWMSFIGEVDKTNLPWRYTLMSGLIPAIPLIIIRPFLPESPIWHQKKQAGTLKRPSIRELFSPDLRRTTIVTTLMFAMSYGAAFGAIQQIPQIVPALPEVQAKIAEATEGKAEGEKKAIAGRLVQETGTNVTKTQELGGLAGRLLLALLATVIISRRWLIRVFLFPGLIFLPIVFGYFATTSLNYLHVGIFVVGLFTVGQFSFWGNYLPRVFPVHLRGTGESFAANIGGRMIGTSFAMLASQLALITPGDSDAVRMAAAATLIGTSVYLVNIVLSFFLPEPQNEELPE